MVSLSQFFLELINQTVVYLQLCLWFGIVILTWLNLFGCIQLYPGHFLFLSLCLEMRNRPRVDCTNMFILSQETGQQAWVEAGAAYQHSYGGSGEAWWGCQDGKRLNVVQLWLILKVLTLTLVTSKIFQLGPFLILQVKLYKNILNAIEVLLNIITSNYFFVLCSIFSISHDITDVNQSSDFKPVVSLTLTASSKGSTTVSKLDTVIVKCFYNRLKLKKCNILGGWRWGVGHDLEGLIFA